MITIDPTAESTAALAAQLPWLLPALSGEWATKTGSDLTPVTDGVGVKLVEYNTQPPEAGRFENHRHHVDVQVCLEGGEFIDVTPTPGLTPSTDYDPAEDLTFYHPPQPTTPPIRVPFAAGQILVLYPEDAHRCATTDGTNQNVRKLVFKIHANLWNP